MSLSLDLNKQVSSAGQVFQAAIVGGVVGAVINLIVFFIFRAAGAAYIMEGAPQNPSPIAVIFSSILPSIFAALLFLILGRFAAKSAVKIFTAVGVIFAILSLGGVMSATDTLTMVSLGLMHLIAAAAIIIALVRNGTA